MSKHNTNPAQLPLFDPISVPLTKGYVALLDPIDAPLAEHKWCAVQYDGRTYAKRCSRHKWFAMHRMVVERMLGKPLQSNEVTDHIDGNTLDNRRQNLRVATNQENIHNSKRPKNNTSGYKGVGYHKDSGKWRACITVNMKHVHLGLFDTPEDAYAAYCEATQKYFGEFARNK